MNKGLIYRVLGALSSALIIISVFVPFIKVTGYSQSLWQSNQIIGTLYLPILIIVFGFIGVIFFALNIKTEFAYATSGAVLFFVLMRTMDVINQNVFNTLSVGYYFLAIGAVFTGVMAFLCNMKNDNSDLPSMSTNIDINNKPVINNQNSVYDSVPLGQENLPFTSNPIPDMNQSVLSDELPNIIDNQMTQSIPDNNPIFEQIPSQSIMEDFQAQSIPEVPFPNESSIIPDLVSNDVYNMNNQMNIQQNPVIQEFTNQNINPTIQEFSNQDINPTVQEFTNNNISKNDFNMSQSFLQPSMDNPVVQEFSNNSMNQVPQTTNVVNNVETDIFGQPINRQ